MKKFLTMCIAIICFVFLIPLSSYAAEKTTIVELSKDYISATFSITAKDFPLNECQITIINPEGREYPIEKIDSKKATQSINNLQSGKWIIQITSETLETIGTIDLKVEGTKTELADADKDIKVAANITGLRTYMKDDYVVCEWNESLESVNVSILDAKTLQELDKDSISPKKGSYYEFKVPSEHKEILVKVVPSTSASVTGAENAYTLETLNNPNASVDFGTLTHTNSTEFPISVTFGNSYQGLLIANEKEVSRSDFLPAGTHNFNFPVKEGINDYLFYVIDERGYMKSYPYSVIGDFIAPELIVERNAQSFTVEETDYLIKGTVKDFDTLTVNGKHVEQVYDDGVFEYPYVLHEGENKIEIVATDIAGNQAVSNLIITYVIPEEIPLTLIIGIIVCIILVAFILYTIIKAIKNRPAEEREGEKSGLPLMDIQIKGKLPWLITPIILLIFYFILTHFLIAQIIISSGSMEPTLKTGDLVFFNRLSYIANDIERGDIVCFWSEEENIHMGKRIIGLPGDKIRFLDGYVVINDEFMDESMYVMEDSETNCEKEFEVPEGHYFVLGDNREISKDSRFFEQPYIAKEDILGKFIGSSGFNISFFK